MKPAHRHNKPNKADPPSPPVLASVLFSDLKAGDRLGWFGVTLSVREKNDVQALLVNDANGREISLYASEFDQHGFKRLEEAKA